MSDSHLLEGAVRLAVPLAFAALGETVTERSGIINISLEGSIVCGAFCALVFGSSSSFTGMAGAVLGGMAVAAVFGVFVAFLRADQIITGTACNLLAMGATSTTFRALQGSGDRPLQIPTSPLYKIPIFGELPFLGSAFFQQPPITYFLYILAPLTLWWLYRTHEGLHLRAVGESPAAAIATGVPVKKTQFLATLFGGCLGGIAGGILVIVQTGTFVEGMSAGRGFIAIAIVALGRWSPVGILIAALLFGLGSAAQFYFQAQGWRIPYQLFLSFPYVLTLIALAVAGRRSTAPRALGQRALERTP